MLDGDSVSCSSSVTLRRRVFYYSSSSDLPAPSLFKPCPGVCVFCFLKRLQNVPWSFTVFSFVF